MGELIALVVIALVLGANALIIRQFTRHAARHAWGLALLAAWVAGAGLGIWINHFFEYSPLATAPRLRLPLPGRFLPLGGIARRGTVDRLHPARNSCFS